MTDRVIVRLTFPQVMTLIGVGLTFLWFLADIKSDIRDLNTRFAQHLEWCPPREKKAPTKPTVELWPPLKPEPTNFKNYSR